MPRRTLVLMRHAKSDWSVDAPDRSRPIGARGRRQATEAGEWLHANHPRLDLVLVSPAQRALSTWRCAASRYGGAPQVEVDERAYTFDAEDLLQIVRTIDASVAQALVVAHNPALDDLVDLLTGEPVSMVTSAIAVLEWTGGWSQLPPGGGRLVTHGRPPAGN